MKKIKLISLFFLIFFGEVFPGGGSYYTRYGLGDLYYSYSARSFGIGELGIASINNDFINGQNPASWGMMRLTRFETGFIYRGNQEQTSNSSSFYSQTIFSGFMIGFPVSSSNGMGIVAGIVPFSNVNYEVNQQIDSNLVDQYSLTYKGIGGISKVFFGLSYKLPLDISLGYSFEYYTGKIQYSTEFNFLSSSSFKGGTYNNDYYYHGIGITLGLISGDLSKYLGFNDINDLRIGLIYSNKVTLNTDTISLSTSSIGTVQNSSNTYKTKLPYRLGVGLSMNWYTNYKIMLDYIYQPFSQFTQNDKSQKNLRDAYKMSLGFEYKVMEPRSQGFWEHVMYRAGLSYEQTQYTFGGTGINQASIYAGISMPMGVDNNIDFGFQAGKRGTTENNLLNENIYKFSITLSIGELWFVRQDR